MALAPYRAAGVPVEELGDVTALHRRSKLALLRTALLVAGLLVIALAAFARAFEQLTQGAPEDSLVAVVSLVVGTGALAVGVMLALSAIRSRDLRLEIRELGLRLRVAGVVRTMLWDDVREVRIAWRHVRRARDRHRYTLVAKDGRSLVVTDALAGIHEIRSAIERECVRRLLPEAIVSVEAGRGVPFGPFVVTKDGLTCGAKKLAWKDMKGTLVVRGLIAVGDKTEGIRVLPKRDGVVAWAKAAYADVGNAAVMMALVERLRL